MKQRARRKAAPARSPTTPTSKCRATAQPASSARSSPRVMGFALIWHIWWLVGVAALGAYATFVVFAWRDATEDIIPADEVARIDRANRSARARARSGRLRHERRQAIRTISREPDLARRPAGHADGGLPRSASSPVTASGYSCSATSSCSPRSSRPTRCWSDATAGGPSGQGPVRSAQCRDRDRMPAAVQLHLRHRQPSARTAARGLWFHGAMAATFVLGWHLSASKSTSSPAWSRAARDRRAARSCPRFSRWSAATACTSRAGLLWLLTMMAQVVAKGFRADIRRRMLCFSLFWHTLDIIWVALFTVVYLMGAANERSPSTRHTDRARRRASRRSSPRASPAIWSGWASRSC